MGFMEHLVEKGLAAKYIVRAELPSLSRPLYEVLLTGTPVHENGICSNEIRWRSKETSVFDLAKRSGLTTAAAAFYWFSELYGRNPFNPMSDRYQNEESGAIQHGVFYFDESYPDSHLVADAEFLRATYAPDFLLIHPMNTDLAGHRFGPESDEYVRSALTIDSILSHALLGWRGCGYDIVVTADHGMNNHKIHGGSGDEERLVPLYLLSGDVAAGTYTAEVLPQLMIAPLLCRLSGIPRGSKMVTPELPGLSAEKVIGVPSGEAVKT
jgi:predicted AlkP superfamily pyrophosphatase or phosphodiesterase